MNALFATVAVLVEENTTDDKEAQLSNALELILITAAGMSIFVIARPANVPWPMDFS